MAARPHIKRTTAQEDKAIEQVARRTLRHSFVLEARMSGFQNSQITALWNKRCEANGTAELCVSESKIAEDLRGIFKRIANEDSLKSEDMRELLTMRYESGFRAIKKQVDAGNLRAVEVMIKLNRAVAELHGLTTVVNVQQNTTNVLVLTPEERQQRIMELMAKAEQRALGDTQMGELPEGEDIIIDEGSADAFDAG